MVEWLTTMKGLGRHVKLIRVDPGGENIKLEKRLKNVDCAHLAPVKCELTARDTPQHNSLIEVSFPYLAGYDDISTHSRQCATKSGSDSHSHGLSAGRPEVGQGWRCHRNSRRAHVWKES